MSAISFSRFRKSFAKLLDQVETGDPLTVARADGRDFVIVAADEWSSLQTTLHELSSPANVKRLREAHAEIEADIARRKRKVEPRRKTRTAADCLGIIGYKGPPLPIEKMSGVEAARQLARRGKLKR